jgi:hypothetical protein
VISVHSAKIRTRWNSATHGKDHSGHQRKRFFIHQRAGRPRGSRNALSEEVICAHLRDFRKHGEKAVAKVRRTQPAAYLKICALLVPRDMKVEHAGGLKALSDEQLDQAIAVLREILAARAGEAANVIEIERTAEAVALTAPDALSQRRYCRG